MIEIFLPMCLMALYAISVMVAYPILAIHLRGKPFSNCTGTYHYTNGEAAESAILWSIMWPAYVAMKTYEVLIEVMAGYDR